MKNHSQFLFSTFRIASVLYFLVSFTSVIHYIWCGAFESEFHADTADLLFWTAASHGAGTIPSKTFHYAYFIPFGGNLVLWPFIKIFGVGLTAVRCGMTVFTVLLSGAIFALFRAIKWNVPWSAGSTGIILAMFAATEKMREIFYGHVIHYSLGFLAFCIALATIAPAFDDNSQLRPLRSMLFGVALAWIAANGFPVMSYSSIPIFTAFFASRSFFGNRQTPLVRRDFAVLISGIAGTCIGAVVFRSLSNQTISTGYSDFYEVYSPIKSWCGNLLKFLPSWISLFCDLPNKRIPIASRGGLLIALRVCAAALVAAGSFSPIFLWRSMTKRERGVVLSHFAMFGIILFVWTCGNISNVNWRLCPVVASAIVSTLIAIRVAVRTEFFPIGRLGIMSLAVLVAASCVALKFGAFRKRDETVWHGKETLLPLLQRLEVSDGYCANYWFANTITAISDNTIRLREVRWTKTKGWIPRIFNSDERWFDPCPSRTRTALVISPKLESRAPTANLIGRWTCTQPDVRNRTNTKLVVLLYEGDFPLNVPGATAPEP